MYAAVGLPCLPVYHQTKQLVTIIAAIIFTPALEKRSRNLMTQKTGTAPSPGVEPKTRTGTFKFPETIRTSQAEKYLQRQMMKMKKERNATITT